LESILKGKHGTLTPNDRTIARALLKDLRGALAEARFRGYGT
jgi:hypothetical protein